MMELNSIKPAIGANQSRKRVGRGIGSGLGKTCGRGHKGQKSRSGGFHKIGFEGGQMPLQRRLPKRGFKSLTKKYTTELRLDELTNAAITEDIIDISVLKRAQLIAEGISTVKVVLAGKIDKAIKLRGLKTTVGARAAIEMAGGSVLS